MIPFHSSSQRLALGREPISWLGPLSFKDSYLGPEAQLIDLCGFADGAADILTASLLMKANYSKLVLHRFIEKVTAFLFSIGHNR